MPRLNRLHNRSSGVVRRGPHSGPDVTHPSDDAGLVKASRDRIAPSLKGMAVPIGSLALDPQNCRLHPERNLKSIMDSLVLYGQRKPVVVRRETGVVVAGNGTLAAAKLLGWSVLAAAVDDMTDSEAHGYGIADNRTAELAKWEYKAMAVLDALRQNDKEWCLVGYSRDELDVLRKADWVTARAEGGDSYQSNGKDKTLLLSLTPDQMDVFQQAVAAVKQSVGNGDLGDGECLLLVCRGWLETRGE